MAQAGPEPSRPPPWMNLAGGMQDEPAMSPAQVPPPAVFASPRPAYAAALADSAGLPPGLVERIIQVESGGNPKGTSPAGAKGLMQLMPETARRFGVTDPHDPQQNVRAGTQYLSWLVDRYKGNLAYAVAAYHAGEGNLDNWLAGKKSGVGPKTRAYVRKVLGVELIRN